MDTRDAIAATVNPESIPEITQYVHYDEKSDALIATNGHLLIVVPKRQMTAKPVDDETRLRLFGVIPPTDKKPTVRLSLAYLLRILAVFDVPLDDARSVYIDIHIQDDREKAVAFTSPDLPGRIGVLMPIKY